MLRKMHRAQRSAVQCSQSSDTLLDDGFFAPRGMRSGALTSWTEATAHGSQMSRCSGVAEPTRTDAAATNNGLSVKRTKSGENKASFCRKAFARRA